MQRNLNTLSALLWKIANSTASLVFLLKCRDYRVFPVFISKAVIFSQTGHHMTMLAGRLPKRLLRAATRDLRARLGQLQRDVDSLWERLFLQIEDIRLWNALVTQKDDVYFSTFSTASQRLGKKFAGLFHKKFGPPNDSFCQLSQTTSTDSHSDAFRSLMPIQSSNQAAPLATHNSFCDTRNGSFRSQSAVSSSDFVHG